MAKGKDWIRQTNVYEVNVRQYTREGTFEAFGRHLSRLQDMGVKTLWFMPITPISQLNKKGSIGSPYACSDYQAINPELGTLADFRKLVQQAQGLGMKVIIDWVANHTGWDHVWTGLHPEWYKRDPQTGEFQKASGMDDIIELDFSNADMRKALIEAMVYWVKEAGIDGYRCDLASWVELDFWIQAKKELDKVKPLFWLAEADALEHPDYMQVFDAAYSWTWMHRTATWYKQGEPLKPLLQILDQYQQAPGMPAWFTSNHDENTWNGTEYEKYGDAARMLAVFSCTWPGVPLIYSGQEIPNLNRLAFFEKDPLHWKDSPALHAFYRSLLLLQGSHPAFRSDAQHYRVHTSADENVLTFMRKAGEQEVLVALNFSPQPAWLDVYDQRVAGTFSALFTGDAVDFSQKRNLKLDPWGYTVLLKEL